MGVSLEQRHPAETNRTTYPPCHWGKAKERGRTDRPPVSDQTLLASQYCSFSAAGYVEFFINRLDVVVDGEPFDAHQRSDFFDRETFAEVSQHFAFTWSQAFVIQRGWLRRRAEARLAVSVSIAKRCAFARPEVCQQATCNGR